MNVISRATWGAAPPKETVPIGTVLGWVVHWVGGDRMNAAPTLNQSLALMLSLQAAAFRGLHGDVYFDIEYNFAIDPAGRIFEGRGWGIESGANGTSDANGHYLSVVYLAGPGVPLTAAAKNAFLWLTQEGARRYPTCEAVIPHDRVPSDSTGCPGPDLTPYSSTLAAHLHDKPAPSTPKVRPMFSPPLDMKPWAAAWRDSKGRVIAAVSDDGDVYAFGVPFRPWPTKATDFAGRHAAGIGPAAGDPTRYTITATSGEPYTP